MSPELIAEELALVQQDGSLQTSIREQTDNVVDLFRGLYLRLQKAQMASVL